jgi:predicted ABC-type transport system involved in lysophospholipase L1 biosynthesis ATPase subunit
MSSIGRVAGQAARAMTLLTFREVSKCYPDGASKITVLDRVSFEIDLGETVGVLAARWAGKTTLLEIAAGLLAPDEGVILWDGQDLTAMSTNERACCRRQKGIALVSGDARAAGSSMTALEYVARPLYTNGLTMPEAEAQARRALEGVQKPHLGHQVVAGLGLVERLRVELAQALAREPRLLLVDEPAMLPRPSEAAELYELLHSLPRQLGCALLIASEEVTALRGAQRMMNLDNGRLYSTDARRKVIPFPELRGSSAS